MPGQHQHADQSKPRRAPVPLELRVLEGALRGARTEVNAANTTRVSRDIHSDVVLRSEELGDRSLAFRAHGSGVRVLVRGGDAQAGQKLIQAGEKFNLPLYTPLRLGQVVIAFGQPDHPAWLQLEAPTSESTDNDPFAASQYIGFDPDGAYRGMAASNQPGALKSWPRRMAAVGASVALVSMSVWALAWAMSPKLPTAEQQAQAAQTALRRAGLATLTVQAADGGGALMVSGYLDRTAQRVQAEQLLAHQSLPAQLRVWVNEDLVNGVRDVFRVHGVPAQIQAVGPGAVEALTHLSDVGQIETIKTVARRDVPGLTALDVRNDAPARSPDPTPAMDDPGKRVASIVPGDPAYIVTADGTRYFEGALLPTGHRIAAVKTGEVVLERGGQTTALQF